MLIKYTIGTRSDSNGAFRMLHASSGLNPTYFECVKRVQICENAVLLVSERSKP